jgi:hypothetical protein
MSTNEHTDKNVSDSEIEPRTRRALEEYLTVTQCDIGDEYIVEVHSQSGETYIVDAVEGNCNCEDAEYNLDDDENCKHVRRARFALGLDAVPADAVETLDIDENLGCATDADLRFATADGGVVEATIESDGFVDDGEEEESEECEECAELPDDDLPCFECYMEERGYTVDVGGDN